MTGHFVDEVLADLRRELNDSAAAHGVLGMGLGRVFVWASDEWPDLAPDGDPSMTFGVDDPNVDHLG
jgi:hypothetical protein